MEKFFRVYEKKLGLRWPVKYWIELDADTCQVLSDGAKENHQIWINGTTYHNLDSMIFEVAHELCHCYLAERIDPVFSTIFFTKKWNKISVEKPDEFNRRATMLFYAWSHIDIWVNDVRHKFWPEFSYEDCYTFIQGLQFIIKEQRYNIFTNPKIVLAVAQCQAEMKRHDIKNMSHPFNILKNNGIAMDEQVKKLVKNFQSLPALKFRLKKDLKTLERSVREVACKLEFPINPRLVREGRWVWSLD